MGVVFVPSADALVSNSIRLASPSECGRIGKMYSLCSRSFSFPQTHLHSVGSDVRFTVHLSDGGSCRQAAPHSIRTQRPASSSSLGLRRIGSSSFGFVSATLLFSEEFM